MSDELLCPNCGSNQLTANKKGFSGKKAVAGAVLTGGIGLLAGTLGSNKVKITCLACGHIFKPGQGATSEADFKQKKKLDKKTGIGCVIIVVVLLIIGLISKTFNNSDDTVSDSKKYEKSASSYSFVFDIDKSTLIADPIKYLDRKRMEISVAYKSLDESSSSMEQKSIFINELMQFDSLIVSHLDHKIEANGYLDFSIPTTNNPKKSMNVYLTSNNVKGINKILFYQEKFNDQFMGIPSNSPMYKKVKQLQYNKVKFTAKLIYFDGIEAQFKEFKKGNMNIDDELKLSMFKNYATDRVYRVEFITIEKLQE